MINNFDACIFSFQTNIIDFTFLKLSKRKSVPFQEMERF